MKAPCIVMLLVVLVGGWVSVGSTRVVANTDDPQPCDTSARVLTVAAPEAFVHTQPSFQSDAPATVKKGMLLGVMGSQDADEAGCWYQVTALQVTAQVGQPALPVPAWIASSTVDVVALETGTPVPSASPVPVAPTPQAPYYVPNAATPRPRSDDDGVPIAPTYPPGTIYAPPYTAPGSTGVPQTSGTVPSVSPTPTATSGSDALVRRVVTTRVCLDRNANTFCDLDEGVAGVPAYVLDPSGQVLAATRTDSGGVASAAIEAPRTAQLMINVPYLNAFQRVTATGETAPILVPMNAPLPGAMP